MLTDGPCWAVAGSDAHASLYRLGPLRRRILSYRYLFSAVNTHLLLTEGWSGDVRRDRVSVYEALAAGRAFVGYDLAAPTRGARFVGERGEKGCTFGGTLSGGKEARLSVDLPAPASIRLLRNGVPVAEATGSRLDYAAGEPGVYRVEARRRFRGRSVGWVFGNPIIVT